MWRPLAIRPLTYLTFWVNAQLGARNPAGYHAVNLLLHLLAAWLLWKVLRGLVSARAAWIAAAIFAVHPFQAEPVNYIFARSTLLATVLCLLSLWCWTGDRRWWAVVWFGAALLAKEECAAFPIFLLLLDGRESQTPKEKHLPPILAMIALAVLAGVRVMLAAAKMPGSGVGAGSGVAWHSYALAQGIAIWRYWRMLVLPWGFTVDPDLRIPPAWLGALAWLGIAALAMFAALGLRRFPAAFWFLSALLLLLPSSSILPAADLAADRRMYLPMIGFATASALLVERLRPQVLGALLVLLAGVSFARTLTWRTEQSLWQDAVEKAPAKVRPKIQLARAVDPSRALELLDQARRIAPEDPRVSAEQGRIYLSMGQPDQALVAFGRALALTPHSAEAFNNRGAALLALEQRQAARDDFERALTIDPCQLDARLNLLRLGKRTPAPPGCNYSAEQAKALRENQLPGN